MKRILSLLMAAVTSLSLAACSADTPEETPSTSQSVSADYSVDSTAAAAESQPTEEQSTAAADNAPSAEAAQSTTAVNTEIAEEPQAEALPEDGTYSSRDDVALYIHTYGHLPGNFITKKEARELGWSGGSGVDFAEVVVERIQRFAVALREIECGVESAVDNVHAANGCCSE